MKDCPDCGEQVADDAVHCGHCGAKVEEERSGKQTMFGVGTVDADSLKSAVDEAQGSGDDSEDETDGAGEPEGAAKSEEDSQTDDGSGGFRLPTPGEAAAEGDDREAAVGLSTEDDEEPVASPGLPEPSDVGDGRLSAPGSDAEREEPPEEVGVEPDEGSSPGFSETISMDAAPDVQEADGGESDDEEIPDTVPTDMAPPETAEGEASDGGAVDDVDDDEGDQNQGTGYERTVEREAASSDPIDDSGASEVESGADVESGAEAETTAGGRFEQADETAPPQQAQEGPEEESDRISTRALLFIAGGLFVFCLLVCAGVIGLWWFDYM